MREILFRGKRLDNGEWVEGWYEMYPFGRWPLKASIIPSEEEKAGLYEHVEIDPYTVGQYTGLTDKNGNRIFDGDIIAVPFEEDRSPWEENCIYYENGKVYFDEMRFGWYVKFNDDELALWEYDDCGVAIIGNIHDNPDLLEK